MIKLYEVGEGGSSDPLATVQFATRLFSSARLHGPCDWGTREGMKPATGMSENPFYRPAEEMLNDLRSHHFAQA